MLVVIHPYSSIGLQQWLSAQAKFYATNGTDGIFLFSLVLSDLFFLYCYTQHSETCEWQVGKIIIILGHWGFV
jgi:hypothetical protein